MNEMQLALIQMKAVVYDFSKEEREEYDSAMEKVNVLLEGLGDIGLVALSVKLFEVISEDNRAS